MTQQAGAFPDNYEPLPSGYPESNLEPIISPYEARLALRDEIRYREGLASGGILDLAVAPGAVVTSAIMQVMHDEAAADPHSMHDAGMDLITRAAELPVDWKVVAVMIGVVAAKSAAVRVIEAERLNYDIENGKLRVLLDPAMRRREHFKKWAGRTATTVVAGALAYKGAEHASVYHDMLTGLTSVGGAALAVTYAKNKASSIFRRKR